MLPGKTILTTNTSLEAIKQEAYHRGALDTIIMVRNAVRSKFYCIEDMCEEGMKCENCIASYLLDLLNKKEDGNNETWIF